MATNVQESSSSSSSSSEEELSQVPTVRATTAGSANQGSFLDKNSLLGVIVDRSSFDDDDELTTFGGKDTQSVMMLQEEASIMDDHHHSQQPPVGVETGGGKKGIVMRNGKVRRKLRWKPRFGRKRADGDSNVSSNASVVSALTNRSNATSRSSSTARSFLSHFSRKSQVSFHTFHSTETPVVTNKANRPKAPQTVMRPNYQDSFDTKHSTIDTEGARNMQHRRSGSNASLSKLDSVSETIVDFDPLASPPSSHMQGNSLGPISPRSPISEASSQSLEYPSTGDTSITNDTGDGAAASTTATNTIKTNSNKPPTAPKPPKQKRPPLFKRRLRTKAYSFYKEGISGKNSGNSKKGDDANSNTDTAGQISPSSSRGLTAHTAPTASLSASISLERENSILPVLSGDEYEEDRRVALPTLHSLKKGPSEEEKKEEELTLDGLLLEEEGVEESFEESSMSPTVADQSIQSGTQSMQSGSTAAAASFATAPATLQKKLTPSLGRRRGPAGSSSSSIRSLSPASSPSNRSSEQTAMTRGGSSGRSSPSSTTSGSVHSLPVGNSTATPHKPYNRPVDSSVAVSTRRPMEDSFGRKGRSTVPVDLDEGSFLEAEHNLRAIHEMASEHLAHGEYEEAIEVFEEILRGQQERYGQDHYRVGTALHNLGIVYLKKGDHKKAIEVCNRAVTVRKEALVPNHPDVAVSLAQLGVAYLESHEFEHAIDAFRDALQIRRNFLGPRHPKCSKILNNIGCSLYSTEDFDEAKKAFDEALDIQRETLRNLPSAEGAESNGMQSNSLLLSLASTLCNIGSIKLRWGAFEEAIVALEEALLIQQSVLGDDHPTVACTLESMEVVETAKYKAENPSSHADFLIDGAKAMCSPVTPMNMAEMLGFEAMGAITPRNWFQNPCAPPMYEQANESEMETKESTEQKGSPEGSRPSHNSEHDQGIVDGLRFSF